MNLARMNRRPANEACAACLVAAVVWLLSPTPAQCNDPAYAAANPMLCGNTDSGPSAGNPFAIGGSPPSGGSNGGDGLIGSILHHLGL